MGYAATKSAARFQDHSGQGSSLMGRRAAEHLADEIVKVINRFKTEYTMTVSEAIGVLEIVQFNLMREAFEPNDDDDQDDEGVTQ